MELICGLILLVWVVFSIRHYIKNKKPDIKIDYPEFARINIIPKYCIACNNPIKDGDLVVKMGFLLGHIKCLVLIKNSDGTIIGKHYYDESGRCLNVLLTQKEYESVLKEVNNVTS